MRAELQKTIEDMVIRGKGILAADESTPTIGKRFDTINVENNEENRRAYRELLFTTPNIEDYISGVILFEETLGQRTQDGTSFPQLLASKGIVPGIKVDKGVRALPFSEKESYTQGLDDLGERLQQYKAMGARFAKWRAVIHIGDDFPSDKSIEANAEGLANYAAICQANGIVPIVEPELLMEGDHTLERCFEATEKTLQMVFEKLNRHGVQLELMVLKPSMVISGKNCATQASIDEVAQATLTVLRRTVPAAVPSINFLSGGQSDELATAHLKAMNRSSTGKPWLVSFSYGRGLQVPALKAWLGKPENKESAQKALFACAKANGEATLQANQQTADASC